MAWRDMRVTRARVQRGSQASSTGLAPSPGPRIARWRGSCVTSAVQTQVALAHVDERMPWDAAGGPDLACGR